MAQTMQPTQNDSKAIASLVLGIVSIPLSFVPFIGIIISILAIYYYKQADKLVKAHSSKYDGRGMAIAGLVTAIVGLVFSLAYLIIWVFYLTVLAALISRAV